MGVDSSVTLADLQHFNLCRCEQNLRWQSQTLLDWMQNVIVKTLTRWQYLPILQSSPDLQITEHLTKCLQETPAERPKTLCDVTFLITLNISLYIIVIHALHP